MLGRAKNWAGVGSVFVRDPLQVIAITLCSRFLRGSLDPQRAEWLRERDEGIERAHELRRRRGMSDSQNGLLWSREILAKWRELDERFRQGVYPYSPREQGEDGDNE